MWYYRRQIRHHVCPASGLEHVPWLHVLQSLASLRHLRLQSCNCHYFNKCIDDHNHFYPIPKYMYFHNHGKLHCHTGPNSGRSGGRVQGVLLHPVWGWLCRSGDEVWFYGWSVHCLESGGGFQLQYLAVGMVLYWSVAVIDVVNCLLYICPPPPIKIIIPRFSK